MIGYVAVIAAQVACLVHAFRHGRSPLWITALLFLPVASAIAYFIVEILPGMGGNRHVRRARAQITDTLDPERAVRAARRALDIADTVANQEALADALMAMGRFAEALPLYRALVARPGGDTPGAARKLARALYETDHAQEALDRLDALEPPGGQSERDRWALLRARILADLGRSEEAVALYADIVTRLPGEEARCRYAALLLELGRDDAASTVLEEVEARARRLTRAQRAAQADMYRWAAEKLTELRSRR